MLNPFWWYSVIWIASLGAYLLGWSDAFSKLDDRLVIFLIATIVISVALGWIFRKRFELRKLKENPHKKPWITIAIILGFIINFIYAGEVTFFSIVFLKNDVYGCFQGIKTFTPVLYTFTIYYGFYLAFLVAQFPTKRMFAEYFAILLMFVLIFNRQYCLFMIAALLLAAIARKKITFKRLLIFVFCAVIGLYAFGVLGDLRSPRDGYNIFTSQSAMMSICEINEKYPPWLPSQFSWAYCYATSTIANLNNNIITGNRVYDPVLFVECFMPDFVVHRLPEAPQYVGNSVVSCMGASTAYNCFSIHGGYLGMSLAFLCYTVIILFASWLNELTERDDLHNCNLMVMIAYLSITIFTNSLVSAVPVYTMFYQCFFLILSLIVYKKKHTSQIEKERI